MAWWQNKQFPRAGSAYFCLDWAVQAMVQDAFKYEWMTLYRNHEFGAPQKPMEGLLQRLKDLGGRLIVWDMDDKEPNYYMVWDHGMVHINGGDGDLGIEYVTYHKDTAEALEALIKEFVGARVSAGRAYVLVATSNGPEFHSIGVAATDLERGNYEQKTMEDFDHVVSDLKTNSPCGRLVVLDGVPGTGKTYLTRALLQLVPNALFVVVPSNLIAELANPGMIGALMNTRSTQDAKNEVPTIFLVEDADECLSKRAADNVNSVSALLNLGDGILGQMFDIRLVCTTNARYEDLDEAVTRPGRLCRYIHVDPLSVETSNTVYERLTGKPGSFEKPHTLAEIYRLSRDGGWKPEPKKHAMGFQSAGNVPQVSRYVRAPAGFKKI